MPDGSHSPREHDVDAADDARATDAAHSEGAFAVELDGVHRSARAEHAVGKGRGYVDGDVVQMKLGLPGAAGLAQPNPSVSCHPSDQVLAKGVLEAVRAELRAALRLEGG